MRIAFDGTVLHGRKSGVGYYSEELLKALVGRHDDEYFVFSHRSMDFSAPSANGNLHFLNSTPFPIRAVYLHGLLPSILNKIKPDICHYTNFLAPISEDRPYVVMIHDMGLEVLRDAHPIAKRLYTRRLIPHVAGKAKLILTNSEYSKWEIVRHLGLPEDRIRITPLAASAEFVPVDVRPSTPYFLYVGNLEPRKNIGRLLEAFAQMPDKSHELVIVGNRWYRGRAIERKAQALGLGERVRFLGYVPRTDLPSLYSGATAFVYPSLLEGFGLPVVEAMACGTPVITSDSTALREVGAGAALLVDPLNVRALSEAMSRVAADQNLHQTLSARGLQRAGEFSWKNTADITLEAYRDALSPKPIAVAPTKLADEAAVVAAIQKTLSYAKLFQYPLADSELRERLFDVRVDEPTFLNVLARQSHEHDSELARIRAGRETISDEAIRRVGPGLKTLASMPFVRMLAFSGSTAHRNMTSTEDIDLFMVVEDGKLWAVFLTAVVWAKIKGLRRTLCMNYIISDRALPLLEHDAFTAQQAASLKPFYGKSVYDSFVTMNPFISRHFPNFDAARHRAAYSEMTPSRFKSTFECLLRLGPAQILERLSRFVLGAYLDRKVGRASQAGDCDVRLEPRRIKLHLASHKRRVLNARS